MIPVISIGSLKTSGTTTLAMTLASVAAAADIPVVLIDAARDKDLVAWAAKGGLPARITVEAADDEATMERLVRAARRRGDLAIIDAGDTAEAIRAAARLADRTLIPVRFSPLSAYAAIATERLLASEAGKGRRGRDWAFLASAVTATARTSSTWGAAAKGIIVSSDYEWSADETTWRTMREDVAAPGHGIGDLILYEVHPKGFTMDPASGVDHPGTYKGIGEMAAYLQDLGITGVELLPVQEKPLDGGYWRSTAGGQGPRRPAPASPCAGRAAPRPRSTRRLSQAGGRASSPSAAHSSVACRNSAGSSGR